MLIVSYYLYIFNYKDQRDPGLLTCYTLLYKSQSYIFGGEYYDQLLRACHVVYCYRLLGAFIISTDILLQ